MTLAPTFAALGDPSRLAILEQVLAEGEQSAGALSAQLPVSAPAVSRHLKVLCDAGLLVRRVDGQRRLYTANPRKLRQLSEWMQSHRAFWEPSLDRLERALKEDDND